MKALHDQAENPAIHDCTAGAISFIVEGTSLSMNSIRERLVYVQRMPHRAATSAPQLQHAFGSLPHLRHAAALAWSSSAFWVQKRAGGAVADFSAAVMARPKVRCGSLWTPSKRALNL